MEYEAVIGLEVHAQLLTQSKMFCSCSAGYQDAPSNTMVCPVCMGMPGVLPVINERAVQLVVMTGLALGCTISHQTKFDRKNYPYPDLMKGYQISQYDLPIACGGYLTVESEDGERQVGITRVHLEEDVAKLMHRNEPHGEAYSLMDVNRAGVPLMEIVGEPDIRTPEEARSYLARLRSILRYVEVSTANMEEGSFRCDANISLRPWGAEEYGAKVEVKNMNSFRSVYRALGYEIERQTQALKEGTRISQETRGWVEERGSTVSQRSKEYASDYRYFPEPDLPPIVIDPEWVVGIGSRLPELPQVKRRRFVSEYAIPEYDADLLTASKDIADYFEKVVVAGFAVIEDRSRMAKLTSNWILGELARLLNTTGRAIIDMPVKPEHIAELLSLIDRGILNGNMAKTVFEEMFNTGRSPSEISEASGMAQVSDTDALSQAVEEAINGNPKPVADFLGGKEAALKYLVGQVMKISRGKANPKVVVEILEQKLGSLR